MKIVTIIGSRPQFIKAATVSSVVKKIQTNASVSDVSEVIVHTGQHYDYNMSKIFFEELDIPEPDYHLGVGSGSHGHMTGTMLAKIEDVIQHEQPDWVLLYGDTNSTLAGALAAAKLHTPVAHVEAGLRSFNRCMPEEINRVLTDHVSTLLFVPTDTAVDNLILTDSAGVQKEAYFAGVPCVTLRDETEWIETVDVGANFLAGADTEAIVDAYKKALTADVKISNGLYGDGHAADIIVEALISAS